MPKRLLAALALTTALAPLAACVGWPAEPAARPAADAAAVAGYELFATKDLDRDGALSPSELALGLAPAPASEARHMFALLDRDQDGRVVIAEYFPDPGSVHAFGFTQHRADVQP